MELKQKIARGIVITVILLAVASITAVICGSHNPIIFNIAAISGVFGTLPFFREAKLMNAMDVRSRNGLGRVSS